YQAASAAVVQGSIGRRIKDLTVADVMDREPVTVPAELTLLDAHDQYFTRYRWPWFAVVDRSRRVLGVGREGRVNDEISAGRPALAVVDVLEENMPVRIAEHDSLESLLGSEGLGRLGAMVAVDADGVLRGVVTLAQVRRALGAEAGAARRGTNRLGRAGREGGIRALRARPPDRPTADRRRPAHDVLLIAAGL